MSTCDDAEDKDRLNVSIIDIFPHTSNFTEHVRHGVYSCNGKVLIRSSNISYM